MFDLLAHIDDLNVWKKGSRRAPHKPLLLLLAFGRLQRGEERLVSFEEVTAQLEALLLAYAPPVKARHQPELPYWHLRSDGLWEVPGGEDFPLQKGRFPVMEALRSSTGGMPENAVHALKTQSGLLEQATMRLLNAHFPESLHGSILEAVGLSVTAHQGNADQDVELVERRRRDPNFRRDVLRAYEHRCALTGFQAALGGTYFAVEAAHVQWHAFDGNDSVSNGMALNPLMHLLFDRGAWSLTDERRVIVSSEFTGSDVATQQLRSLHGQPLRDPLPGCEPVSVESIRWHREPDLGGVFREPGLQL